MSDETIAQRCLNLAGLFEAEVLVELMLRFWHHPMADEYDYRNDLLEKANQVLERAADGIAVIEPLKAADTNLIAAIWYAESTGVLNDEPEQSVETITARKQWLAKVRTSVPSCFGEIH
ncbi:hypothetical protein [uncultured Gimesia sp.]|uniref:hypothetical protein n=1 Tax=uncultured Gimesia sp. TaxID=1678688 RepID=UPI0026122275|nr:hypothetical protein [uncultured Gimesia sp.]